MIARSGGKDILIMNWGAHLTMTGGVAKYDLSADYIGATRKMIERDADMHFAFFQRAGGNQVPDSWIASEKHNLNYTQYGERLAQVAMVHLPNMMKIEGAGIDSIRIDLDCAVNHDGAELIREAQQVNALYTAGESRDVCNAKARELGLTSQYHARAIVARQTRPGRNKLRLDAVRIGGMAFVAVPYEMFSDHAVYIKEHSPFENTVIATCANGDVVYIPTAEAYDYGCYESYVSYFAKGTGEQAADQLIEMLNSLKYPK